MTLRFTTTRAIGTAIALTLGTAATAAAQTTPGSTTTPSSTAGDSSRMGTTMSTPRASSNAAGAATMRVRKDGSSASSTGSMPVRKDNNVSTGEVLPAPAPAPAPVDSTAMMTPAPAPVTETTVTTTTTTTVEAPAPMPVQRSTRFGNGFYLGLGGGTNFPQNEINTYYDAGYNVNGQLGWDPQSSPLGLRLNLNYNRLNGRNLGIQTVDAGGVTTTLRQDLRDADLYSAFLDAKLRLPFGRFLGATSGLYAVGGGGVAYFRNYANFQRVTGTAGGDDVISPFNAEDVTRFGINGGAGLSWGIGNVSLFAEGRYVRVFTQGRDTDYVPVTVGLTFH